MTVIQKKVCLLGDFAVGKTSLIRRFVEGRFDDKYLSTIGVKISRKSIDQGDHTLNLIIWDLAGSDDFNTNTQANYLRGAAGALIVCDVTRLETLQAFQRYSAQVWAVSPSAPIVFAGNKVDLTDERAISDEEVQAAAEALNSPYVLTSAKTGAQVDAAFEHLARRLEAQP